MGALFGIGSTGLSAGGRGFWGQSGHDDSDIKSKLFGGFLVAEYALQIVPRLSPYVYGGIGRMVYNYDEQLTDSARMLGGGIAVDLNGPALRLDGSWIGGTGETDGIGFVGIAATVRMPLGAG
jgi:hypothetical protein